MTQDLQKMLSASRDMPQYQQTAAVNPVQFPNIQEAHQAMGNAVMGATQHISGEIKQAGKKWKQQSIENERAMLTVTIGQNYDRLKQEQLDNLTQKSPALFKAKTDAFNQGLMSAVSKDNQGAAMELMSAHQINGMDDISNLARAQSKSYTEEHSIEYSHEMRKQIELIGDAPAVNNKGKVLTDSKGNQILAKDVLLKQYNNHMKGLISQGISGSFVGASVTSMKDASDESTLINGYTKLLLNKDVDGAKKYEQDMIHREDITWEQKRTAEIEFGRLHGIFKTGNEISKASAKDNGEGALDQVANANWDKNDARFSQARSDMIDAGLDIGDFDNRATAASLSAKYAKMYRENSNKGDLSNYENKFIDQPGDSAQQATINKFVRSNIDKIRKSSDALMKSDPVSEFNKTEVKKGVKTLDSIIVPGEDGKKKFNIIDGRMGWQKVQNIPEKDQRPLSNDEANQLSNNINVAPDIASKISIINDALNGVGKYQPQLVRQLKKIGVPEEIFALQGLPPESQSYSKELATSFDSKVAILDQLKKGDDTGQVQKGTSTHAQTELADFFSTIPNTEAGIEYKNEVSKVVTTAALGHMYQNASDATDDTTQTKAAEKMAKVLYGNRFEIVDNVAIPRGVDVDNATQAMKAITNHLSSIKFKDPQQRLNAMTGKWWARSDMSGADFYDAKSDAVPGMSVSWKDLDDPTSEVSKLMAEHPKKTFLQKMFTSEDGQ